MNAAVAARLAAVGCRAAEVEERFILGAGRGGQKVQKTSSSVWLRHRPTGLEVRCQQERSQSVNRRLAWEGLCAKLEERQRRQAAGEQDERERARRRGRQKSRSQKVRMIRSKQHRARTKAGRGGVGEE